MLAIFINTVRVIRREWGWEITDITDTTAASSSAQGGSGGGALAIG